MTKKNKQSEAERELEKVDHLMRRIYEVNNGIAKANKAGRKSVMFFYSPEMFPADLITHYRGKGYKVSVVPFYEGLRINFNWERTITKHEGGENAE